MDEELPDWMNYGDDEILELLQSEDVFSPDHVAEDVPLRGPEVATRCRELAKHGLLNKPVIGMYEVTDLGERFLAGEVDPEELAAGGNDDADGADDAENVDGDDAGED
ncbi:hypothetical protein [Halosolutus halophilus]|uniref:hypothetical protein n=1 Tax=Halosolutus halophilus TaxID=1552990 RepID=UPI0022350552|nr:hypothetical protein [Halosolutus halophilus]